MHRSLLQVAGAGALTLVVALATPSYAGSYRHRDPAGDMVLATVTCPSSGGSCTGGPLVRAPRHRDGDITRWRVDYVGNRVDVAVRLRAFGRSNGKTVAGPARSVSESWASVGGLTGAVERGVDLVADAGSYVDRLVNVELKIPNHGSKPYMSAVRRPNGRLLVRGFGLQRTCRGVRGHLDRGSTSLHVSMPRSCFGLAGKVRVALAGFDDQHSSDGTTDTERQYVDDGLSRSFRFGDRLTFSPWIHHN